MNYNQLIAAMRQESKPSRLFDWREHNDAAFQFNLEILGKLPEIGALIGIPQPPKFHPEGDCFSHIMEVIDRAAELGANDATLFACLVHDLGKGVTPKDNYPHHYNHEALGKPIVRSLCCRLNVPADIEEFAVLVTAEHLNCHRFADMRPVKQVDFLRRIWTCNLYDFTLACQCDAQGRGTEFRNKPYPQAEFVQYAARIIGGVSAENKNADKWRQEQAKALESERKRT